MAVTLSENYGGRSYTKYIPVGNSGWRAKRANEGLNLKESVEKNFRDAFLPQGYPNSVSKDYLKYQTWDTLQAFCSYITGTLATQAVLKGVGVGDSSASPVAATITWLLKDGLGMIGRILFAWLKGTDLDCNAKRWRLIADILNDIAMFLDLLAPVFPALFMIIICLSSVTRSIVGVAGGATRAALVQHQARRDNMADVSAKDGSQETIVSLAGLIIGLILTPLIADKTGLVWLLFIMFTCLHLYANYQAVSVVCMETFNTKRLHLFMKQFLISEGRNICTPEVINFMEPVIRECPRRLQIKLGSSLSEILQSSVTPGSTTTVLQQTECQRYIVYLASSDNTAFGANSGCLDHLQAIITAEIIEYLLCVDDVSRNKLLSSYTHKIHQLKAKGCYADDDILLVAREIAADLFNNDFISKVQNNGWVTSHHLLGLKEWRYTVNDHDLS